MADMAGRTIVLLTGARTWRDYSLLAEVLLEEFDRAPGAILMHGQCERSPDEVGSAMWRAWGGTDQPYPADWGGPCRPGCPLGGRHRRMGRGGPYCPLAGIYRNSMMVAVLAQCAARGAEPRVVAFITPQSKGAVHCADAAQAAGLAPRRFTPGGRAAHPGFPAQPQEVLF